MKKEAEQKKQQAERVDRRMVSLKFIFKSFKWFMLFNLNLQINFSKTQRPTTPPEDNGKEMTEAEREKIGSYEEAFEKIKEETGVNSMHVNIFDFSSFESSII
jgi:hypothetical protein